MSKVAKQEGGPLAVDNFQSEDEKKIITVKGHYRTVKTKEGPKKIYIESHERELGYQEMVKQRLKRACIEETEERKDPQTGKS